MSTPICDNKLKIENDNLVDILKEVDQNNRARVSTLFLNSLRNFVEHVMVKIYSENNNVDLDDEWDNILTSVDYCKKNSKYNFLVGFRERHLHASSGHRTISGDFSEAILLIYYPTLIKIKHLLKKDFNYDVLQNINKYPLDLDNTFLDHYRKIWKAISDVNIIEDIGLTKNADLYYVQKKKSIYFDGHLLYELILSTPSDTSNKFDRFVAFSKIDIFPNYAIRASIVEREIELFGSRAFVMCIDGYSVSIRACEFENFASLLGAKLTFKRATLEYKYFMDWIQKSHLPLSHLLDLSLKELNDIQEVLESRRANAFSIIPTIKRTKSITDNNKVGSNILRYLLYTMRNKVIRAQYQSNKNSIISDLNIKSGSLYFDEHPFCCNLCDSKQRLVDVLGCIDISGKEAQLLQRELINTSDETGQLYTKIDNLNYIGDIDASIKDFNNSLSSFSKKLSIGKYGKNVYIEENEKVTKNIIIQLYKRTRYCISGYKSQADAWITNHQGIVYGEEKKNILSNMFTRSTVYLIYGAAGTGKSTMINFVFQLFGNVKKLCLAPTYPALENMIRKIDDASSEKMTIQSFIKNPSYYENNYDVVVIDECSVVSNRLMNDLLKKLQTKVLILSGDIFQIPSIDFGNWFHLANSFLPETAKCELTEQFRTSNETLKTLWKKVRSFDDDLEIYLASKQLVSHLDQSIFTKFNDDEVILCLNYDGLFGVNNINLYLQTLNKEKPVKWYQYTFKVNDPILFTDVKRFDGIIYNNLKGVIKKIDKYEDRIVFEIAIERILSSLNFHDNDIEYICNEGSWTVVRFSVFGHNYEDYDGEPNSKFLIPFHVAYAVSIHKAQGLEYNSVKIVIANNIEDKINHNIFYTAITRAKNHLMIYWTPETEKIILSSFKERFDKTDFNILKSKWIPSS